MRLTLDAGRLFHALSSMVHQPPSLNESKLVFLFRNLSEASLYWQNPLSSQEHNAGPSQYIALDPNGELRHVNPQKFHKDGHWRGHVFDYTSEQAVSKIADQESAQMTTWSDVDLTMNKLLLQNRDLERSDLLLVGWAAPSPILRAFRLSDDFSTAFLKHDHFHTCFEPKHRLLCYAPVKTDRPRSSSPVAEAIPARHITTKWRPADGSRPSEPLLSILPVLRLQDVACAIK